MTVTLYPNGPGCTLGDEIAVATEIYATGFILYVHHTGSNSNQGITRQKPFASLAFAITQLTANSIIVLLDGHTETISSAQSISVSGAKIVGEGSNNGRPTVRITSSLTAQSALTVVEENIAIANICFPAAVDTTSASKIMVLGLRSMIRGCRFELGEKDQAPAVEWDSAATGARIYNSTFVSVSGSVQPYTGFQMNGTTDGELEAVTFDGGNTGFGAAGLGGFDASFVSGTPPARLRCQQMQLLNGASFSTGANTTGYFSIISKSGSPAVSGFNRRLPNGFRQIGDALLADIEFYYSGDIIYVHYGTGSDTNGGTDELAPKKTVASALTAISKDCSIIVLLPGHIEPLTTGIVIPAITGITIIGCGQSGGKPSCKIYRDQAGASFESLNTDQVSYIRNIWFAPVVAGNAGGEMVSISGIYSEMRGCLVTPALNDANGVTVAVSSVTCRETKFESAGISVASRPSRGLVFSSEGTMTDEDVRGCEFSNGAFGFSLRAFDESESVARLYVIAMTQSFGADIKVNSSTTGLINPETASGSSIVEW